MCALFVYFPNYFEKVWRWAEAHHWNENFIQDMTLSRKLNLYFSDFKIVTNA